MKQFEGIAFSNIRIYCGTFLRIDHLQNWIESPEIDFTWIYRNIREYDLWLDLPVSGKRIEYLINDGGTIDYPMEKMN